MPDGHYANIREIDQLGRAIGTRIVDITQHDEDEFKETRESYVCFHLDNGLTIKFIICDAGFEIDEPDDDAPQRTPPIDPA